MTNQKTKGLLVVLSGPSGVGKGTVCQKLDLEALNTRISTSMTTRKPRDGEVEGLSYYFVSQDDFMKAVENGEMLEYDCHFSNCYGTPKKPVDNLREQGKNVLLEIDTNGARQVMEREPDTLSIFWRPRLNRNLLNGSSDAARKMTSRFSSV